MKSGFVRFAITFLLISALSFLAVFLALPQILYQSIREDKVQVLSEQSDILKRSLERQNAMTGLDYVTLGQMQALSDFSGVLIWRIDSLNQVYAVVPEGNSNQQGKFAIAAERKERIVNLLEGQARAEVQGRFEGFFTEDYSSILAAYTSKDGANCILVIHQQNAVLHENAQDWAARVMGILLLLFIPTAVVLLIYVYWRLQPCNQIQRVADAMGKGDFSKRVAVGNNSTWAPVAQTINTMAEDLGKNQLLLHGFVANVSHELRAPLTAIQGFLYAMVDGTIPPENHQEYLQIVLEQTQHLSRMVNEWLDLSMIESGQFPLHETVFSLNEWIRRVLSRFEVVFSKKHQEIEIVLDKDYQVYADAERMEQVLANILDNASKFSPEGGRIKLWTYCTQGQAYVSVEDSGPGIAKEDIPFIWERFYKADKAHTPGLGSGLGLSIAKKIIEQHGQKIWVAPDEGPGTTFVFTIKEATEAQKR